MMDTAAVAATVEATKFISGILFGAAGSILAVVLINVFLRTKAAASVFGSSFSLAQVMRKGGIKQLRFSREDYNSSLRTYLSRARHSISIISISLKGTHDESDLIEFFRTQLAQSPNFRIRVSLLAPKSGAAACAAASLNLAHHQLDAEIKSMLRDLLALRSSLPIEQQ